MSDTDLQEAVRDILYSTDYFDASTHERYEEVVAVADKLLALLSTHTNEVLDRIEAELPHYELEGVSRLSKLSFMAKNDIVTEVKQLIEKYRRTV